MTTTHLSRRQFLKAGAAAGAGLTLGFYLPASLTQAGPGKMAGSAAASSFAPNAFVRIGTDGSVTVIAKHVEMGQGSYTGLATLVAEDLDADWSKVNVEGAPADAKLYNNLAWGEVQGTGGSSAIANSYDQLRKAGAENRGAYRAVAGKPDRSRRAGNAGDRTSAMQRALRFDRQTNSNAANSFSAESVMDSVDLRVVKTLAGWLARRRQAGGTCVLRVRRRRYVSAPNAYPALLP